MCGIAGIIGRGAVKHEAALRRMVGALKHRGPDGQGMEWFAECGLGHTRLCVIDPEGSAQPMLSPDRQVALTFNGEIYGFKNLRDQLRTYPFQTQGDTEVILALYRQHGVEMLSRLPGMFAFALWDDGARQLFCARDRFGEKPFYYAMGRGGELLFASEIKAIVASGLMDPAMDRRSLAHYLQRLYVPPGRTIYRNIHSLPPAHSLTYRGGNLVIQRYWLLPAAEADITMEQAVEQFSSLLEEAVKKQLVADVPVGTFLSGGLDSSTIVALSARHHSRCKTFSFRFGDGINELPFARAVAERYRTEHVELSDQAADIAGLVAQMQEVYDEPLADSSNVATYLISKLARHHVVVALAGEGGDELLGGYSFWYRPLFNLERTRVLSVPERLLWRVLGRLFRATRQPLPARLAACLEGVAHERRFGNALAMHWAQINYFSGDELRAFELGDPTEAAPPPVGGLNEVLQWDIENYLSGDVLVKTDRASMANSLEIRCPFLDVDLASFCLRLPWSLKISERTDKCLLREAFGEAWPPIVRNRGKQGFGAPVEDWLKRPEVAAMKNDLLRSPRSRMYQLLPFAETARRVELDNYQTWILLVLALWCEKHPMAL